MPYITKEQRKELLTRYAQNAGELNYLITNLCLDYFKENGNRYQQINDVVGAQICAVLELYRRKAAPYEDEKIQTNGDVY